jgi:hypothetical protein
MNNKGAFNIMALIIGFITIVGYVALLPVLNDVISDALPYADAWTSLLIQLFPLIIALMIIYGLVSSGQSEYGRPMM